MRLFNTMSQQVEEFTATDGKVSLYVCGVTPYDTAHLGHAFVFATFDTLVRVLRARNIAVSYAQNVTDIDDPLFEKAQQLGNITWDALAKQETDRFLAEMSAIHVAMPDYFVHASEELPAMFDLIQKLLDRGYAYQNDGWIYFDVRQDQHFADLARAGGLSGYDNLLATANQNGNDGGDPRKRDPLDFVLWRHADTDEPSWPSPFGLGRPGWHIECSAMATKYLGPQIDIHGGGTDLIFPHHSCEIAQSENASGQRPYVRHWMHIAMVGLDGIKMSKSLGNLVIINQLLAKHTPDAIRTLIASHHYRTAWEYTDADMANAQVVADRLLVATTGTTSDTVPEPGSVAQHLDRDFMAAIDDDLDTPQALATLDIFAHRLIAGAIAEAEQPIARHQLRRLAQLIGLELRRA